MMKHPSPMMRPHPLMDDDDDNDLHGNPHLPPEGDDGDSHGAPHLPPNEMYNPTAPDPASSLTPVDPDDEEDEGNNDANGPDDTNIPIIDGIEGSLTGIDECEGECESDVSSNATSSEFPPTESKQFEATEAAGRATANSHDDE